MGWLWVALKSDGTVWTWGYSQLGQLGDGTVRPRREPIQVEGLESAVSISASCHNSFALKEDGTIVAWGDNSAKQLGDTDVKYSPVPVVVGTLVVDEAESAIPADTPPTTVTMD